MLSNRSVPKATVIPELPYPDVGQAIDWLCAAFGFTLRVRIGNHRGQLNVGDGAIVVKEQPKAEGRAASNPSESGYSVMVRVEDADAHCERARQHGARILRAPTDFPYGERQYNAEDFAGHRWNFTQSVADVAPEQWGGTSGQL